MCRNTEVLYDLNELVDEWEDEADSIQDILQRASRDPITTPDIKKMKCYASQLEACIARVKDIIRKHEEGNV